MEVARWKGEQKFKNRWGDPGASCRLGRGSMDETTTLRPRQHGSRQDIPNRDSRALCGVWKQPGGQALGYVLSP